MRWFRRGWYWPRDYWYIARAQLRGAIARSVPARYRDGGLAPVVLLAGVWEPWSLLRPCAEALSSAGHPVHVIDALGYNHQPISVAAATVMAQLRAEGLHDVVLVAHSKGGLVGKHLLVVDDEERRIDRLVAVATPFSGARLARLVPSRTIRALGPADPSIAMLRGRAERNDRITSIFADDDPHIPEGSRLPGAINIEVPVVGHFRLLSDPRVIEAVVAAAS